MQLSDVIALIGAGYTKADIEAMEAQDQIDGMLDTGDQEQKTDPAQPESAPTQPVQAAVPATDPALMQAIKDLTAAVQHSNKINTPQPVDAQPNIQEQADKILTQFLNT